jgi:hypothetical protein
MRRRSSLPVILRSAAEISERLQHNRLLAPLFDAVRL